MLTISLWSRRHILMTRFIIVLLNFVLVGTIWFIVDQQLLPYKLLEPKWWLGLAAALFLVSALFWRNWRRLSLFQKKVTYFFAGLAIYTLVLGFFASDSILTVNNYGRLAGSFSQPKNNKEKPVYDNYTNKGQFYLDTREYYKSLSAGELKTALKKALKKVPDDGEDKDDRRKITWLVFALVAAVIAIIGIAVLSCYLLCSGYYVGIAVLVLGLAACIWFIIWVSRKIKGILRRRKKLTAVPAQAMR